MIYDSLIIGAGVVGAATAYAFSKYDMSIAVLEAENDVAMGTTKANSGIIHSGYDPRPGTLMAKLNVRGAALTKEICERLDVSYKQTGALVLAFNDAQYKTLERLYAQGLENAVEGLEILTAAQLLKMQNNISPDAIAALYSPTVAVVEPWDLCLAMLQTAVKNGTELFCGQKVTQITRTDYGFLVTAKEKSYMTKTIFNAAGLHADKIHNMISKKSYTILPSKGEYFLLDKSQGGCVDYVIFKAPEGETKGVLVAPTVHGNLIIGPNSSPNDDTLASTRQGMDFIKKSASEMVLNISYKDNIRNFAGVRAISDRDDFIIEQASDTPGFFDLAGIKSPGLSAAAAIGESAVELLRASGASLNEKSEYIDNRRVVRFNKLTDKEKTDIIAKNSDYGCVVCRCEGITRGEIIDSLSCEIPPVSLDGVKRRVGAGMGRCQGGFCGVRVMDIMASYQNKSPLDIIQDNAGSYILTMKTKKGDR